MKNPNINTDDLIEDIVYMIFDAEVELDNPSETIKEIKEKLKNKYD